MYVVPTASAAALTITYVSTTGSDTSGAGTAASPYATIGKGVSAAAPGTVVMVAPGVYHELVNITNKVTLQSQSGDPSNTVIDASGISMGIFIRGPSAAGTVVQGFTVKNANDHGIYAQDTSSIIIEHNILTGNGVSPNSAFSGEDKALEFVGTAYSVMAGNTVVGNLFGGIAINDNGPINPGYFSPGTLNPSLGNVISGNIVSDNRPNHCSIVVSSYDAGAGVINNIVSNNVVVDNSAGIVIAANTPNSQAINNSVIFNTILNNGEAGVILHANAPGAVNKGTVVMGNTISGNGVPTDIKIPANTGPVMISKYTGVLVGGESTKVSPQNSVVTGNVFHNQYYGVYVVNATQTSVFSNTNDATVTVALQGAAPSLDSATAQLGALSSTVATLQTSLNQLQASSAKSTDISSLTQTVTSLSSALTQLQSSAAKSSDLSSLSSTVNSLSNQVKAQPAAAPQSDLNALSTKVDNLTGQLATTSYIAYAAIAVAILLAVMVMAVSRRRPSK